MLRIGIKLFALIVEHGYIVIHTVDSNVAHVFSHNGSSKRSFFFAACFVIVLVQCQAFAGCLQCFVQTFHNRFIQQCLFSTFSCVQLDDKVCQIADFLNLPITFIILLHQQLGNKILFQILIAQY